MASYALLSALSGFRYSAVTRTLFFGPKLPAKRGGSFTTFFSAASGFGTIQLDRRTLTLNVIEGELAVDTVQLTQGDTTRTLPWGVVARAGEPAALRLSVRRAK
jgi:hypothetical protein